MDKNKDEILILVRGNTYERPRGKTSLRFDGSIFNLKSKWPKNWGEYGHLWAFKVKGNRIAYPSIKEVVMGIYNHHMLIMDIEYKEIKENKPDRFELYRTNMRKTFNHLLICLDMNDTDIDKPLTHEICRDPYNPQTQLILLLYSMEPPFYADLNNACRTLDKTKLHTLGPFARVVFEVLLRGEYSDEKRNDAIE